MYEVISHLGWVGIPLLLCSILALAIVVERAVNLRSGKLFDPDMLQGVRDSVEAADQEGALRVVRTRPGVLSQIMRAGLETYAQPIDELRGAIRETARHEGPTLQRNLGLLGTIAAIAPMLGLLGTVSGMAQTFSKLTVHGVAREAALASGIYEALYNTVFGLVIAIPSLVAHNHFGERTVNILLEMERRAMRAARTLRSRKEGVK